MGNLPIGYVVIEYNQASHMPGLTPFADLHNCREDAQDELDARREATERVGRRERYAIGCVELESDDEQ